MVLAVKHGMSYKEAMILAPVERRAFIYTAAQLEGAKVNWSTGHIKYPEY